MIGETELARLGAYVDGELSLQAALEVEQDLERDPRLRAEVQRLRELSATVREQADYHAAPAALRARLDAALPPQPAPSVRDGAARRPVAARWIGRPPALAMLALAALVAAVLLVGGGQAWLASRGQAQLQAEVIASHVRSTLGQHLVDIASSDHHVVKPWLSARLDFSPTIPEPLPPGVVFVGGRIDFLDDRPVAALNYRLRAHVIDAFTWPDPGPDTPPAGSAQRGWHLLHWRRDGMAWWLISDLDMPELRQIATDFAATPVSR